MVQGCVCVCGGVAGVGTSAGLSVRLLFNGSVWSRSGCVPRGRPRQSAVCPHQPETQRGTVFAWDILLLASEVVMRARSVVPATWTAEGVPTTPRGGLGGYLIGIGKERRGRGVGAVLFEYCKSGGGGRLNLNRERRGGGAL